MLTNCLKSGSLSQDVTMHRLLWDGFKLEALEHRVLALRV